MPVLADIKVYHNRQGSKRLPLGFWVLSFLLAQLSLLCFQVISIDKSKSKSRLLSTLLSCLFQRASATCVFTNQDPPKPPPPPPPPRGGLLLCMGDSSGGSASKSSRSYASSSPSSSPSSSSS
mmetsp:Transcript_47450/g.94075  ORF Transcript_47450/g.94075 Transcript_47450/m.94075 type:complete len:123 (-) Transcript_47450:1298-1666(-)